MRVSLLCRDRVAAYTCAGMSVVNMIGLLAAVCTTCAFVPQVVKSWRTHQTRDISQGWLALLIFGVAAWIVYGVLRHDLVIIAANVATLLLVLTLLALKLKHH